MNELIVIVPAAMIATAVATYLVMKWKIKQLQENYDDKIEVILLRHSDELFNARKKANLEAMNSARTLMKNLEKVMRAVSVKRSKFVTLGKIAEHFAPYLPGWNYNPQDARFLGSPIDFIVFDGMSEGVINEIVLIEIKTGNAKLSSREQDLQDVVCLKKVKYEIIRIE